MLCMSQLNLTASHPSARALACQPKPMFRCHHSRTVMLRQHSPFTGVSIHGSVNLHSRLRYCQIIGLSAGSSHFVLHFDLIGKMKANLFTSFRKSKTCLFAGPEGAKKYQQAGERKSSGEKGRLNRQPQLQLGCGSAEYSCTKLASKYNVVLCLQALW